MKIAINCMFCFPQGGGIKEYIINLTNYLAKTDVQNEYILYVLEDQYNYAIKKLPSAFRVKTLPYKNTFLSKIKRSLFSQRFWSREERMEAFDIFHSPFYYAPKMNRAKLVLTVHDMRLYRYPNTYGFLRLLFLKNVVKDSIARADIIIAISQFTKNEIVDICKVKSEKVVVIHEAINRLAFSVDQLEGYTLPNDYSYLRGCRFLFSLSHIEPRKNYVRLIKAFSLLKAKGGFDDLRLIIAGRQNLDADSVLKLVKDTPGVDYLDYVPGKVLFWLYHHASLFVFPSYYEGFGFPPLEAASLGTVSVVSNVSSIPEVCGDCAFYFNPYDEQDICNKIYDALSNEDKVLKKKKKLYNQLNKFSWENNAHCTLMVYEQVNEK